MTSTAKKVTRRTCFLKTHEKACWRRIIVTIGPADIITLRAERLRQRYILPISTVYDLAVKVHVEAERLRKRRNKRKETPK